MGASPGPTSERATTGALEVARDALAVEPRTYPYAALQRLRSVLEGLSSSLAECEADIEDDDALAALEAALTEALEGE